MNSSGRVLVPQFQFYYIPSQCSFGQLSPIFHGKYGKFVDFVVPDGRPIVPQAFVDQGITERNTNDANTCQGGGGRGGSITLDLPRNWCLDVDALNALGIPSPAAELFNQEAGCAGFSFAEMAAVFGEIQGLQNAGCPTSCPNITRFVELVDIIETYPEDAQDIVANITTADASGDIEEQQDICGDQGLADMNLCWIRVVSDFPGLFPFLYLAVTGIISYIFFLMAEFMFIQHDKEYWKLRDELTELDDPDGKVAPYS